jgi:hypothetical protein
MTMTQPSPIMRTVLGRTVFVPGLVLAAWTLLLWSTRVRNAVADDSLVGWSRTWQVGIAVIFVVVGLGLGVSSIVRARIAVPVGVGLAVFGSLWWTVRWVGILLHDHSLAFTIVHTILAIGTVAISVWLIKLVASRRYG